MSKPLLSLFLMLFPLGVLAQLNKSYGQMEKGLFAEAKANLLKNRAGSKPNSKDIMEAYFGLYSYYSTEANPEANADNAWLYLDSTANNFKEEFKVKYKPYEAAKITRAQLDTLKAQMELRAYKKVENTNTVAAWKQYIGFYTKSNNAALLAKAEKNLHQKAYSDYAKAEDLAGLESFVTEYKNAVQVDSALALIDHLRWKNALKTNTRDGYVTFIKNFPKNKKIAEANDTLSTIDFRAVSKATTTGAFKAYLAMYPASRFKAQAESKICLLAYDSVMTVNREAALKGFAVEYAGCPQVGVIREKLERMECEKCLAAPTKDCLALVMKNCGNDNAIAQRVTAALMAMVDQNKAGVECEKCLANPTKACLILLYKNCAADSGLVKRANDVFLKVINKERDQMVADSMARLKAAPGAKSTPAAATAETRVDTAKAAKPQSPDLQAEIDPMDKLDEQ